MKPTSEFARNGFKRYNKSELKFIKENYGTMKAKDIATHLGRTTKSIGMQAYNLRLSAKTNKTKTTGTKVVSLKKQSNKCYV
jgi:hypothetical protein